MVPAQSPARGVDQAKFVRRRDDHQADVAGGDGIRVKPVASRSVTPVKRARGRVQSDHLGVSADLVDVHDEGAADQPLPVHLCAERAGPSDTPVAFVDSGDGAAQVGVHGAAGDYLRCRPRVLRVRQCRSPGHAPG